MNLYNLSQYFLKLSALEFGEGTEWIPKHFKERKEFKDFPYKNAIKVFKKFGLNDFRTSINIDNDTKDIKNESFNNLINTIINYITQAANFINSKIESNLFEKEIENLDEIYNLLLTLKFYLIDNIFSTKINKNIFYKNKIIFNIGTSIFRVYNKIKNELKKFEYNLPELNKIQEFKDYSNAQKPAQVTLVFSTKTSDICGIGSRGILSCQNLFGEADTDLSPRLIGAILSKYLGVCYITNGSNWKGRGEKMLYRSLVRLLINFETNGPVIVVDKLYPTTNDDITKIIIEELQKRSKLPVLNIYDINLDEYSVKQEPLIPEDVEDYKDNPIEKKYNLKKEVKLLTGPDPGRRLKAITNILIIDPNFVSKNITFINELPYELIRKFIYSSDLDKIIWLYNYPDSTIRRLIAPRVQFNKYPNEFKKIMLDTNSNVVAGLLNKYTTMENSLTDEVFNYFATLPENKQQFIIDSVHKDVGNKFVEYMEGIGKS